MSAWNDLIRAICSADVPGVQELLETSSYNVSANGDKRNQTALHCAVSYDNVQIVELLLKNHVDVHCTNSQGESALHLAAQNNKVEMAKVLMKHGSDPSLQCDDRRTPLHWAARLGNVELFHLLKNRDGIKMADGRGRLPLHEALSKLRDDDVVFEMVEALLEYYPEAAKHRDHQGRIPLHYVCKASRFAPEAIQIVLRHFPDAVYQRDDSVRLDPLAWLLKKPLSLQNLPRRISILQWLGESDRTILSLKNQDAETCPMPCRWDAIVTLLWYHYFGFDNGGPPMIAATRDLSDEEFKNCYKWMVHAASYLLETPGGCHLLEQLYRIFDKHKMALEICEHTGRTPLLIILQVIPKRRKKKREKRASSRRDHKRPRGYEIWKVSLEACRIPDAHNIIPLAFAIRGGLPLWMIKEMIKVWPASVLWKLPSGMSMYELALLSPNCRPDVAFRLFRHVFPARNV